MSEKQYPPGTVDRAAPGILWRNGGSSFLGARVISLWMRLRQSFPGQSMRRLRVRETLALGDKRQLLIVECGERQLLIGAAGNFLTMLTELPVAEQARRETACE